MIFLQDYANIIGIMQKIDELNEKLNGFANSSLNNIGFGTLILFGLAALIAWAIKTLAR